MKNKCRILVGIMLLFLISCKTETVSDDEYEVLNLFINQILEPKVVEIESSNNYGKLFSDKMSLEEELNKIDSIKKYTPLLTSYLIVCFKSIQIIRFSTNLFGS